MLDETQSPSNCKINIDSALRSPCQGWEREGGSVLCLWLPLFPPFLRSGRRDVKFGFKFRGMSDVFTMKRSAEFSFGLMGDGGFGEPQITFQTLWAVQQCLPLKTVWWWTLNYFRYLLFLQKWWPPPVTLSVQFFLCLYHKKQMNTLLPVHHRIFPNKDVAYHTQSVYSSRCKSF